MADLKTYSRALSDLAVAAESYVRAREELDGTSETGSGAERRAVIRWESEMFDALALAVKEAREARHRG